MIGDRSMERQCNGVDKHDWQKTTDLRWEEEPYPIYGAFEPITQTYDITGQGYCKTLQQLYVCTYCGAEKWEEV
jgi:hypothetical protein